MKRLLLAGAGHAHLQVLKSLAARRRRDVEVVLVTPHLRQMYSGMLPGWIAGHYALAECAVRLEPLPSWVALFPMILPLSALTISPWPPLSRRR